MNKKSKISLLFLVLAITPFFRGCSAEYGFPFAIAKTSGNLLEDILSLPSAIKTLPSLGLLIVNILLACLLAIIYLRYRDKLRLNRCFEASFTFNLCFIWFMLVLSTTVTLIVSKEKDLTGFWKLVVDDILFKFFFWLYWDIPSFIDEKLILPIFNSIKGSKITISSPFVGHIVKVWFIAVVFLLAGLLYLMGRIRGKYLKAKSK